MDIVTFKNGGDDVNVLTLSPEFIAKYATFQDAADAEIARKYPSATQVDTQDHTTLPSGKFRSSWRKTGSTVSTDMTLARAEHIERMRVYRDKKLAEEDVIYLRAIEDDDATAKSDCAARKQVLRDLPSSSQFKTDVDAAADEAALDAIWPTEVDARP
jgi:hypothetical protein